MECFRECRVRDGGAHLREIHMRLQRAILLQKREDRFLQILLAILFLLNQRGRNIVLAIDRGLPVCANETANFEHRIGWRDGKMLRDDFPGGHKRVGRAEHRITSYNVCYTKLLRAS